MFRDNQPPANRGTLRCFPRQGSPDRTQGYSGGITGPLVEGADDRRASKGIFDLRSYVYCVAICIRPHDLVRLPGHRVRRAMLALPAQELAMRPGGKQLSTRSGREPDPIGLLRWNVNYSVPEIAALWGISEKTVRRLFEGEEGVLCWGHSGTLRKRRYHSLRVRRACSCSSSPRICLRSALERLRRFGHRSDPSFSDTGCELILAGFNPRRVVLLSDLDAGVT